MGQIRYIDASGGAHFVDDGMPGLQQTNIDLRQPISMQGNFNPNTGRNIGPGGAYTAPWGGPPRPGGGYAPPPSEPNPGDWNPEGTNRWMPGIGWQPPNMFSDLNWDYNMSDEERNYYMSGATMPYGYPHITGGGYYGMGYPGGGGGGLGLGQNKPRDRQHEGPSKKKNASAPPETTTTSQPPTSASAPPQTSYAPQNMAYAPPGPQSVYPNMARAIADPTMRAWMNYIFRG